MVAAPSQHSPAAPALILINGPPAAGKSTLARRYAEAHPLTLSLDIDQIRAMIGGWQLDPAGAGRLAREIAVVAAAAHLTGGHDVVIPQLVARIDFISRLASLAAYCGAAYREIFLDPGAAAAIRQYADRARSLAGAAEPDPAISTDRTPAEISRSRRELLAVLAARPATHVVRTRPGQIDQAYTDLIEILGR